MTPRRYWESCSPDLPLGGVAAPQTSLHLRIGLPPDRARRPPSLDLLPLDFCIFKILCDVSCFWGRVLAFRGVPSICLQNAMSNALTTRSGELLGAALWPGQLFLAPLARSPPRSPSRSLARRSLVPSIAPSPAIKSFFQLQRARHAYNRFEQGL